MRINDAAVDWILQVSRKRRSKRQDDIVKIFECLGGPWIDGLRETRFDTTGGIPSIVPGSEAKIEAFHSRYQRGPFYIKGKSIGLFFWMN